MSKKQNFMHKQESKNSPLIRKFKRMTKEFLIEIIEEQIYQNENANYLLLRCLEDGVSDKLHNSIVRCLTLQGYEMKDFK